MRRSTLFYVGGAGLLVSGLVWLGVSVSASGQPPAPAPSGAERPGTSLADELAVFHSPPGVLIVGEATSTGVMLTCPATGESLVGTKCVELVELVYAPESGGGQLRLPYVERQGYAFDLLRERPGVLRYKIAVHLADGRSFEIPGVDGATEFYEVPVAGERTIVKAVGVGLSPPDRTVGVFGWGNGNSQVGFFAGTEGEDFGPSSFSVQPDGSVFVADSVNERLHIVDGTGKITTNEMPGFGSVALDPSGNGGFWVGLTDYWRLSGDGEVDTTSVTAIPARHLSATRFESVDGTLVTRARSSMWESMDSAEPLAVPGEALPVDLRRSESQGIVTVETRRGFPEIARVDSQGNVTAWAIDFGQPVNTIPAVWLHGDSVVAAIIPAQAEINTPDAPEVAYLVRLGAKEASARLVSAEWVYMYNGPKFDFHDGVVYVMSGHIKDVTIDAYAMNDASAVELKEES